VKKSFVANLILTFILIALAVGMGIFLNNFIEKNKNLIKKNEFYYFDKASIFVENQIQDPEYFRFFILTNSPLKVDVYFYNLKDNSKATKTYYVDGYLEVVEDLTKLFSEDLDNTNLVIYFKIKNSYLMKGPSVYLKNAKKVLIINTNIPSILQANFISKLKVGETVFYFYDNVSNVVWYDPYQILKVQLNDKKIEKLDLNEDFNLKNYNLVFKDNEGNPVIGVYVYLNSFNVGLTDYNGELEVSYHKNKEGYVKIEDRCYYLSKKVTFNKNTIVLTVENLCKQNSGSSSGVGGNSNNNNGNNGNTDNGGSNNNGKGNGKGKGRGKSSGFGWWWW
jgi:hypothetical protein